MHSKWSSKIACGKSTLSAMPPLFLTIQFSTTISSTRGLHLIHPHHMIQTQVETNKPNSNREEHNKIQLVIILTNFVSESRNRTIKLEKKETRTKNYLIKLQPSFKKSHLPINLGRSSQEKDLTQFLDWSRKHKLNLKIFKLKR